MISAIVATPLQLFNVIMILRHHYPTDKCDMYVLDIACDMHPYLLFLKKVNNIGDIFFIKNSYIHKSKLGVIWDYLIAPRINRDILNCISIKSYNTMLTTFVGPTADFLYGRFRKKNPNIVVRFYDEGTAIYVESIKKSNKKTRLLYKLLNLSFVEDHIESLFMYRPDYCRSVNPQYKRIAIGNFSHEDNLFYKSVLKELNVVEYHHKLLYMESGFHGTHLEEIDEMGLIRMITDAIGLDSVLVRPHPRTSHNKLLRQGLRIDYNYDKNWENILALNKISNEMTIIAPFSTTLFTPKMIFDIEPRVIFTGLCIKNEHPNIPAVNNLWFDKCDKMVNSLKESYSDKDKVIIPNSYAELFTILRTLKL